MHSVPILWTTDTTPIPDLRVTGWPLSEEGAEAVFTLELPRKGITTEDPLICEGFPLAPTDTAIMASVLPPLFARVIAPPPQTEAGEMVAPMRATLIGPATPPPLTAIEAPDGAVVPPPPNPLQSEAPEVGMVPVEAKSSVTPSVTEAEMAATPGAQAVWVATAAQPPKPPSGAELRLRVMGTPSQQHAAEEPQEVAVPTAGQEPEPAVDEPKPEPNLPAAEPEGGAAETMPEANDSDASPDPRPRDMQPHHTRMAESPIAPPQLSSATPPQAHAPPLPQIVALIRNAPLDAPNGTTELVLTAEDLGALRIHVQGEGERITLRLTADRPETLDLMRRHAEQLATDLRDAGFRQVDLGFGGWRDAPQPETPQPAPEIQPDPALTAARAAPPPPVLRADSALYLRL